MIAQRFTAPLGHPSGAGYAFSVAVLSKQRLADIGSGDIVFEDFIRYCANLREDVTAVGESLVVLSAVGDGEAVTLITVPFRVNAVKRK